MTLEPLLRTFSEDRLGYTKSEEPMLYKSNRQIISDLTKIQASIDDFPHDIYDETNNLSDKLVNAINLIKKLEEKNLWFDYKSNPQSQKKWERPMTFDPRRNFNNDNYNNNNDHKISTATTIATLETGAKNDNRHNSSSVFISNNLNNSFDELRSMTTGQIAHLCKLQQQQDRERRQQQQQAQEDPHQQQPNNDVVATKKSNKPLDTYMPLHLSLMPLLSITQRAEPGRLDVRMHSLREELSKFGYQPS